MRLIPHLNDLEAGLSIMVFLIERRADEASIAWMDEHLRAMGQALHDEHLRRLAVRSGAPPRYGHSPQWPLVSGLLAWRANEKGLLSLLRKKAGLGLLATIHEAQHPLFGRLARVLQPLWTARYPEIDTPLASTGHPLWSEGPVRHLGRLAWRQGEPDGDPCPRDATP